MPWAPTPDLGAGETVIADQQTPMSIAWPWVVLTLGLGAIVRPLSRWVLTDRRVIALAGPPGNRRVESIPLGRIQDAAVATRLWQGYVHITCAGGPGTPITIGPLTAAGARQFANAILDTTHNTTSTPPPAASGW